MLGEDGKPMPHRRPRSNGSKDTGDMLTVKMIILKKRAGAFRFRQIREKGESFDDKKRYFYPF